MSLRLSYVKQINVSDSHCLIMHCLPIIYSVSSLTYSAQSVCRLYF